MLIFDASSSCWFNIYFSKFIELIKYREFIYDGRLYVFTYNTTYSQISVLIFMFMSIQRVRTFSSISYRESRLCAFMLTLIAFVYGIIVSYFQIYDEFCVEQLKLNSNQTQQIDSLINQTQQVIEQICAQNDTMHTNYWAINQTISTMSESSSEIVTFNDSLNNQQKYDCRLTHNWHRVRHRAVAYVYLQSYMSIDWPDEHKEPSQCDLEDILPDFLLDSINNLTRPELQSRPGKDYFLEHQFCTQTFHFINPYGNCSWPLSPLTFKRFYQFLYDRRLSWNNRYTIGFIIGTFIPSSICIVSSIVCLYYIANRPLIRKHSHSRAELRSLSLILVEILLSLMSALQSYAINFFTCHRLLFRMQTDNCYGDSGNNILPNFLGSIVELFTSTSNIVILMICGSQFRNELIEILHLKRFCRRRRRITNAVTREDPSRTVLITNKSSAFQLHTSTINGQNLIRRPIRKSQCGSSDSLLAVSQNKEERSSEYVEQADDNNSPCLIKLTAL